MKLNDQVAGSAWQSAELRVRPGLVINVVEVTASHGFSLPARLRAMSVAHLAAEQRHLAA